MTLHLLLRVLYINKLADAMNVSTLTTITWNIALLSFLGCLQFRFQTVKKLPG